ncbi:MAG: glutathione S-transferase family protein [Alphaproteobacteria bacterium]|nr:glutathione S-transferase family protein [Alphaproteobacteria bacterium]
MSNRIVVIGSYLSPYVRKVLVCLEIKGLAYEVDPIVPFYGDERFSKLSPLRRIPVLIDGDLVLSDSSVICQYLEDRHPQPALYPADVAQRARARWFEEYADSRMGDVFIWRLFNQVAIRPAVWAEKGDRELMTKTLTEDIPQVLDYLEAEVPADGFLFGELSIADIALASFFRNAAFARFTIDAGRWPRMAAYVARVLDTPGFARLRPLEDALARTPIAQHRARLAELGAPLCAETWGTPTPRRGIMPI